MWLNTWFETVSLRLSAATSFGIQTLCWRVVLKCYREWRVKKVDRFYLMCVTICTMESCFWSTNILVASDLQNKSRYGHSSCAKHKSRRFFHLRKALDLEALCLRPVVLLTLTDVASMQRMLQGYARRVKMCYISDFLVSRWFICVHKLASTFLFFVLLS